MSQTMLDRTVRINVSVYSRSIGMTDADDARSSISTKLACESPTFDSAMKTDGKYVMGLGKSDLNR